MNCSKCGKEYDDSFRFCPACGESNPQIKTPPAVEAEQVSISSETMPSTSPPADYQGPAATRRPRRKGKVIAIVAAAVVVVLGLLVVLGTLLIKGYEGKAKTEAQQFVQNALKKDYEAVFKQITPTSYDTMWLYLVCLVQEGYQLDLPSTEAVLKDNYESSTGVLSALFDSPPLKLSPQIGKDSSTKVTSINGQTFYVALNYKNAAEPFPLFIKRQKNIYSVDLAATLAFNNPIMAKATRQAVESILKNPTIEGCDTAQKMLSKAKALKSELELWLKRGPEGSLSDTKKAEINEAIKETQGFGELYSRVEKARQEIIAKETEPKTTAPKESAPAPAVESTPTSTAPAAKTFTEKEKKQIYYELVKYQDSIPYDPPAEWTRLNEESYQLFATKYGTTKDVIDQIAIEGATKGWPMPEPPPS